MLVYGDPEFGISAEEASRALFHLAPRAAAGLTEAREFLIACGQVEQAVCESGLNHEGIARATDDAAERFLAHLKGKARPRLSFELNVPGSTELRVKIPEGFAFYCVYPEQYIHSAEAWAANRPRGPVTVVGLRSIGTSLSALVAASLRRLDFDASRLTVRPIGDPFRRSVRLDGVSNGPAIVVDEGPGLSGSSIACVARALRSAAVQDLSIFPGHAGDPGAAASEETLTLWKNTPRFAVPHLPFVIKRLGRERPFEGAREIGKYRRAAAPVETSEDGCDPLDLGGGNWRKQLSVPHLEAFPLFERAKYLTQSGTGGRILWKFAGLASGPGLRPMIVDAFERQTRLAKLGWTLPPIAQLDGFVATQWVQGLPLSPDDLDLPMIQRLADWLADASVPQPPSFDSNAAFERLRVMAVRNLGESAASAFQGSGPAADFPLSGDGRTAPHEWIRASEGRLVRTDVWGHDRDHTWIGPQPIHWDVAGTILHWKMDEGAAAKFMRCLAGKELKINRSDLNPYFIAWRAFQAGLRSMNGTA